MAHAKKGDTVTVHYTGKFEDGAVFDTSTQREPLEFTLGEGQVIPGFEAAVVGMEVGETRETRVASDNAYGPRREEMVLIVDRDRLPQDLEPEVGQQLAVHRADGQVMPARITDVSQSSVTLDANHPLAGKDLQFELQLVGIR